MRVLRLNQRRIALLCAIILVGVSIAAVVREYLLSHPSNAPSVSQVTHHEPTATATPDIDISPTTSIQPVADDSNIAPTPSPTASPTPTPTPAASTQQKDYSYTAQAGDSYTAFVRDALTKYTNAHMLQLSADQQLDAEVAIVNAAGSPELEIGQAVTVTTTAIEQGLSTIGTMTASATANSSPSNSNSVTVQKSNNDYIYTAQIGDSYTTLARQAVTAYIQAKSIKLSVAQRIAAESSLTAAAGQPAIDINQIITITNETVTNTVKQVQQLSADQTAAWQTYTDLVAL